MIRFQQRIQQAAEQERQGAILVLAAVALVVAFAMAAFTVDFGMVTLTKTQLQTAADSAAHAAVLEVSRSFGPGYEITPELAESIARDRVVEMVGMHRSGDRDSTFADRVEDVRVGRRTWDEASEQWIETWGSPPYNMVEVQVRRIRDTGTALPLTFARFLGHTDFEMMVTSKSALIPSVGFKIEDPEKGRLDILPIALDLGSWNNLMDQIYNGTDHGFDDGYEFSFGDSSVDGGEDGVPEISMYPDLNNGEAPGNRGTVDFGSANNSTSDLKRQITDGLNDYDLSFFPDNEIRLNDDGALYLNGDTGISAGIQSSLKSIIGEVRIIPIFIEVNGQGNNATYTVVKFAAVRIMDVKLSGGPKKRHLTVQPTGWTGENVIRGETAVTFDSILSTPVAIR